MKNFKGKSIDMEKKINGLFDTISKKDKTLDLEKIFTDINDNYLNVLKDIGDLKYDNLIIQKIQDIQNKKADMDYNYKELLRDKMYNNNNEEYINNMNNQNQYNQQQQMYQPPPYQINQNFPPHHNQMMPPQNNISQSVNLNRNNLRSGSIDRSDEFNLLQNDKINGMNNDNNNFNNMNNGNIYNNNINNPPKNYQDNQINKERNQEFTYQIVIFLKNNNIYAYNEKHGVTKLNLISDILPSVPDHSKYVNLGQSVLLTGGKVSKDEKSSKCYLISLIENNSPSKYEVNIDPYEALNEPRERHNLIFLPNKNTVFACGGFYTRTCEYTDLYKLKWEFTSSMNKSRGNATMAYINNRFLYILGGYQIYPNEKSGSYLNDLEYFDMDNFSKGWTLINFINKGGYNLALCAMGVVPIADNQILLCGGFSGKEYQKDVYKFEIANPDYPMVDKVDELKDTTIFMYNMFCKIRKSFFNFDIKGDLHGFDVENRRFGVQHIGDKN